MSLSNIPIDPLLLEYDQQNNNKNSLETISLSKQGEKEGEVVSDPHLRHTDSAPEFGYKEYHPPTSHLTTCFEHHSINSTNSEFHSYDQQSRNPPLPPPQNLHPAPSDSYRPSDDLNHQATYLSKPQQYEYPLPQYQPFTSKPYESNSSSSQNFDGQSYRNQVPGHQPFSSHSIDGQLFNDQFASNQISNSRSFDSQRRSLHHKAPDHSLELTPDGYPILRPGALTMSLIPPPTHDELDYLKAWTPQNGPELDNFFAQRPSLHRCSPNVPLHDQLHGVIRIMLFEQAAFESENNDINHNYDQLCLLLLGHHRIQCPEEAAELQRTAASQITPTRSSPPPIAGSQLPSSGHHSTGLQSLDEEGNSEQMKGTDEEFIEKWDGGTGVIDPPGVAQDYLHTHSKSSWAHTKDHPEAKRLMLYPPSTGTNLSDHDILQMVRLTRVGRHQRASDVYTDRGEYKRGYKRFTEMSDDILRREGLLRSWIPRTVSDRPTNSVERAERAIQLGLTGDHRLFADAAAERIRRAQDGMDHLSGRVRARRRRAAQAAGPEQAAGTLGVATPSFSTAAVTGAETQDVGTTGLTTPASEQNVFGAEFSGERTGGWLGGEAGPGVDQQLPVHGSHRVTSASSLFLRAQQSFVAQEDEDGER
ncbi:hypothetical protein EAF04_009537 [Stromatinia cepivora]|nr:hypothetical protein EAF04_009537 [Stromatinia cepivora]